MSDSRLLPGDQLAINSRYSGWMLLTIEKITPSGRIKLGDHYTLNPDLTVRGADSFSDVYRAELVTHEILDLCVRNRCIKSIRKFDWSKASTENLARIARILKDDARGDSE